MTDSGSSLKDGGMSQRTSYLHLDLDAFNQTTALRTQHGVWVDEKTWKCLQHECHVSVKTQQCPAKYCECRPPATSYVEWALRQERKKRRLARKLEKKATEPAQPLGTPQKVKKRGSVKVTCAFCGEVLWRKPSDLKRSKTGLAFCNGSHQNAWRKSQ